MVVQENDSEKQWDKNSDEDHEEANMRKAHVTRGAEALQRDKFKQQYK